MHVHLNCYIHALSATPIIVQCILAMFNASTPCMLHPQICSPHPCRDPLHLHLFPYILTMSLICLLDPSLQHVPSLLHYVLALFNASSPCSHHFSLVRNNQLLISQTWFGINRLGAHEHKAQPHNLLVILCSLWALRLQRSAPDVTVYTAGRVARIPALSTASFSYLVLGVNHLTE
jgi:hypothetical protein